MQVELPSSFLWGAALSSYQCEGGNFNTDWSRWEKDHGLEPAAGACGHYRLYSEDFRFARELKLNSLRFSTEWARICPSAGVVSEKELTHYRQEAGVLRGYNIEPLITLHHFTNPLWFMNKEGWLRRENIDFFLFYLQKTVTALKGEVSWWLIFNEPLVYIYNGYLRGIWPPGKKSLSDARKALNNILAAYLTGFQEIKRIYRPDSTGVKISLAKHFRVFRGCPGINFGLNSLSAFLRNRCFNQRLIDYLEQKHSLDFIGINYYCKEYTRFRGVFGGQCRHRHHAERKNYLGWDVYPEGFYQVLKSAGKSGRPLIVTENGTAETNNQLYEDFLADHLKSLGRAVQGGVDVRGYFWWSLLDNFEWDRGFKCRFGLLEVDYATLTRKIRPFAHTYAKICRENRIEWKETK